MQDAFGGLLNMVLIVVFLVIVSGILGFTFSYTKAFRMKNYIITTFEEYDGIGCETVGSSCQEKIAAYANELGYAPTVNIRCNANENNIGNLFCSREKNEAHSGGGTRIFTITTQVDLNIPIINKIMGLRMFQVSGDTRELKIFSNTGGVE